MIKAPKNNRLSVEFLWNAGVTLVCIGVAFGTLKTEINSLNRDIKANQEQITKIESLYMRIDVYEARHQAVTEQLKGISDTVKDITQIALGKSKKESK
jgi:hypothetical protein